MGPTVEANSDEAILHILHRFNVEGEEKWYTGYVISYNAVTCQHEIVYDGEEENVFF